MKISKKSLERYQSYLPKFNGILGEWKVEFFYELDMFECSNRFIYQNKILNIKYSSKNHHRFNNEISISINDGNEILNECNLYDYFTKYNNNYYGLMKNLQTIFCLFQLEYSRFYSKTNLKIMIKNVKLLYCLKREYIKIWI